MLKTTRQHSGFAGHLIVADSCRYHLTTDIGDYRISTVGAYVRPDKPEEFSDIGYKRKYETLVFRLGDQVCGCGCGRREVADWCEIDANGYNDPKAATDGHEEMCQRYEAIQQSAPTVAQGATP
jgi:hypothetical protein